MKTIAVKGDTIHSVQLPDWKKISFSSFDPTDSAGSIDLGNGITINWSPGTSIESILPLKTVSIVLGAQSLNVKKISKLSGVDLGKISLVNFSLAGSQTLKDLVKIVPTLGNRTVKDVAPIAELLKGQVDPDTLIKTVAKGILGDTVLNTIDLSSFNIHSIPKLDLVAIEQFKGWEVNSIDSVPGLAQLPWGKFPIPIKTIDETLGVVARIDAVWGLAEKERLKTVSGGYNVGFEVPCVAQQCPYIELDDLENQGSAIKSTFEGKSWISGKSQKVPGGSGCLVGEEPTGRHPYGDFFKVSVEDPIESTDMVTTAIYFRICIICGCTGYVIGPFPFITYQVNDPIFLGIMN